MMLEPLEVWCPICRTEVLVGPALAGRPARCGVCGSAFQVPALPAFPQDRLAHPAWRRVAQGLQFALVGGFIFLVCLLLLILLFGSVALQANAGALEGIVEAEAGSPAAALLSLGICGVGLVALAAVGLASLGSLLALAVPTESGARGPLGVSLASLVTALALGATTALLQLRQGLDAEPALFMSFLSLLNLLLVLTGLVAYGQFLSRLAALVGADAAARSARSYQQFLAGATLLLLCGLMLARLFGGGDLRVSLLLPVALLALGSLFTGWWLKLTAEVRAALRARLPLR